MDGIDLHTHSNISDGTLSPQQLVQAALEKGLKVLALTDHDTIAGLDEAKMTAQGSGLKIIDGCEISSQWSRPTTKKTYAVHIVALNMQRPEILQNMLKQQQIVRAERAKKICELLQGLIGEQIYPVVLEKVAGQAENITRTHIAKTLLEKGYVSRTQQAFDKYLKEGKKAYVQFEGLSLSETIATIHASEGFAVLAHPTKYDLSATNIRYLIELFAKNGGDAVELPPNMEATSTRQMIDRMIKEHHLKVSIGSDFHGENMPWIKLGQVPRLKPDQIGIWEQFK